MNRSGSYDVTPRRRQQDRRGQKAGAASLMIKTTDVWLMNMIAIGLGLGALALFIIGMLVGTGVTTDNTAATNFQYGSVWLLGSISLAAAGLAFRREHHIPNADVLSGER